MKKATIAPDPLRFVEDALATGRRSVTRAELATAFGKSERSVRRLPLAAVMVGGTPWYSLADVQGYLGRGKRPKARRATDDKAAKKVLERFGI